MSFEHIKAIEKNRGRIETRHGYILNDVSWLSTKNDWQDLKSVGMIMLGIPHPTRFVIDAKKH